MSTRAYITVLILFLLTLGCASSRQLDEIQLQVNVLEQQNRLIEEKLIAQDSLSRSLLEALQVFKARTEFAGEAGDARLDELGSKLNDILDRIDRLQQSVAALQQGLVRSGPGTVTDTASDTLQGGFAYVDARKLFDRAFKDMASGDYSLAILGFREYVKTFPNTDLTDDAQFWIGECFYRQADYNAAGEEYAKIERDFPNSDKMASALYKLGRCFEESGNMNQAVKYYERTVARYPETQEAELAKGKLQNREE